MGRYFFSISDGARTVRDREGTELAGLADVQEELIEFGLKVLKHRFSYGIEDSSRWSIDVSNEDGRVLTKLPLAKLRHPQRHLA